MATMLPPGTISGPPIQPPEAPTLSSIPIGGQTEAPGPGQVGALPRLFFNLEQQVETIARVLPPALAAELSPIMSALRAVLVKALQSGAGAFEGNPEPTGLGLPPSVAGPVGGRPTSF